MTRKRTLVLRIPEGSDREKVVESIMKAVQVQFASFSLEGDKLKITLVGDPASIARSVAAIKKTLSRLRLEMEAVAGGRTVLPKGRVASILGFPLPIEMLERLLELRNIPYDDEGETIRVHAPLAGIRELAKELYELYQAARYLFSGKAREVATLASYETGADLGTVLKTGLEIGVFAKREEDGRAVVAVEKTVALVRLIEALSL
uniref:DUF2067 domain-containing protein n=1 Tax=Fervidicoccus fontis TaxID=683846 RepID=A0A7J3ZJP9_9CREN